MLDVRNLNSNSISFNKNIKRQQDLKCNLSISMIVSFDVAS
jgi:hypothetical protein